MTNSLESNDMVIAHSAYARYRKKILATVTELYEMRGDPALAGDSLAEIQSLHSKYMIFDDDLVFIGSLNLDPRSLYLNTELGVVLRSAGLARALRESFGELIDPHNSWRVTEKDNALQWESSAGVRDSEPARSHWQLMRSRLLGLIPVSGQM